ncbi:MAG: zinc-ribbon domain-containing protein [Bacteroidota bacterium]
MDVFFFILLGTRPMVRQGEATIRRYCPRCGDLRNFREVRWQNWLTLFFIPVFPLGRTNTGYACVTCSLAMDASMAADAPAEDQAGEDAALTPGESLLVQCPRCDGRMRVPLRERGFVAICPHCAMEFRVKGQREAVPEAGIKE